MRLDPTLPPRYFEHLLLSLPFSLFLCCVFFTPFVLLCALCSLAVLVSYFCLSCFLFLLCLLFALSALLIVLQELHEPRKGGRLQFFEVISQVMDVVVFGCSCCCCVFGILLFTNVFEPFLLLAQTAKTGRREHGALIPIPRPALINN